MKGWLQRRRDRRLILEFVVWRMRHRDLPAEVSDAALRLVTARRVPRPARGHGTPALTYTEPPWTLCAFPRDESKPLRDSYAFTHQLGAPLTQLLDDDTAYVLLSSCELAASEAWAA